MADDVTTANAIVPNDVLVLDSPGLWGTPRYRDKLLASLAREGFDARTVELVRQVFAAGGVDDFDAFARAAETPGRNDADRAALQGVVAHWRAVRSYNATVYRAATPEDYKIRNWPNNPKVLADKRENYADIFTADLTVKPKRFITKDTAIASAGSCFAANISRQLQHWGYNYIVEMRLLKRVEEGRRGHYPHDPAGCGNIYNAVAMRQMVERAFGEWYPEKILVSTQPRFIDPFRSAVHYDTLEGYERAWQEHNEALSRALRRCEVFVLTLGLTEAWYFADTGDVTSTSPRRGDSTLLRHRNLTARDNIEELERLYAVFKKHNPGVKFIATVSPVPLNATFNLDRHVVVANALSKATLRVALEEFCTNHPDDVYYFPSYEIVTTATRDPWYVDMRHVSNAAVTRVMQQFQKAFMVDQQPMDILPVFEAGEERPAPPGLVKTVAMRQLRERVVHPLKRALGIEGRPFRALIDPKVSNAKFR